MQEILFPKKNLLGKICLSPFENIEILPNGNVNICGCVAWMPTIVGNIFQNKITDILNFELVKKIQRTILDGTYQYCNEKRCKIINNNELLDANKLTKENSEYIYKNNEEVNTYLPKRIYFSGDLVCNLSCPSCRTRIIKYTKDEIANRKKFVDIFYNNLFASPNHRIEELIVSTSGELFASEVLLDLLRMIKLENFPKLKLHIQTNGLLMKKRWHDLHHWEDRVSIVNLTADSSNKKTYEILRRGGKFESLIEVLEWFKIKKKEKKIYLICKAVIQKDNFTELLDFYNFYKYHGADEIHFARIQNSPGKKGIDKFEEIDVFDKIHPLYPAALEEIKKIKNIKDIKLIGDFT